MGECISKRNTEGTLTYFELASIPITFLKFVLFYLEHEKDGVEYNEGHDEILKGSRLYNSPQLVFITLPFL